MDSISSNDMVKYVVVLGLVYTILKLVPSQDLSNKDLLLIILVVAFGLVCVDCFIFKNTERFANALGAVPKMAAPPTTAAPAMPKIAAPTASAMPKMAVATMAATSPKIAVATMAATSPKIAVATMAAASPKIAVATMAAPPSNGCGVEVAKVKRDLELKINQLTDQIKMNQSVGSNSMIASKYYSSLINELNERGVLDVNEIQNIKLKIESKLLSIDEVIASLERLKATSKAKPKSDSKTDHKYDELPSEFYSPMGGDVANKWDNNYTLLDTNRWQVPMPRPPVCINTAPCKVCPTESGYFPVVTTKEWDQSRKVSDTKINKDWANAQVPSNK